MALEEHQKKLEKTLAATAEIIETIKSTLKDIKKEKEIEDKDLYEGFHKWSKEQSNDGRAFFIGKYIEEKASIAEKIVLESIKDPEKTAPWTKQDWEIFTEKITSLFKQMVRTMQDGYMISDPIVQKMIKAHYQIVKEFHHLSTKVYLAYADLYEQHPTYKAQLDPYHKDLSQFLSSAMRYYCQCR